MEPALISAIDLILVPVYFFVLLAIILAIKKRRPNDFLVQKYLVSGFLCKVFGGLLYALLVYYYWGFGDTASYFKETLILRDLISAGKIDFLDIYFKDYAYLKETYELTNSVNESGFTVVRISLLLSYIGLSRFLLTTMVMSIFSLAGLFKLFSIFVSFIPKWHRFIAWAVLFFPSVNIYGSGILKDTVCIAALSYFFYSSYYMFIYKKVTYGHIIAFLVSFYLIFIVKAYIIGAFLLPFIIFLCMRFAGGFQNKLLKNAVFPVALLFFALIYLGLYNTINSSLGVYSVEKLQDNVGSLQQSYSNMTEDNDSNFDIGTIEPSLAGIMKKLPVGIVATLYRPFLWEARKIFMMFSALESLFLFLFTIYVIYKTSVGHFLKQIFTNPQVFLLIFFVLLFSGLVGISALNFGTLARYRIPAIPFYLVGLLLILNNYTKNIRSTVPRETLAKL